MIYFILLCLIILSNIHLVIPKIEIILKTFGGKTESNNFDEPILHFYILNIYNNAL